MTEENTGEANGKLERTPPGKRMLDVNPQHLL